MLKNLLSMKNEDDFFSFCSDMNSKEKRTKLYSDIEESNLLLLSESLMISENFNTVRRGDSITAFLEKTSKEDESVRAVHNLQLVAECNPGLKRCIKSYLDRICV